MVSLQNYPRLMSAALYIGYDSGMINRYNTREQFKIKVNHILRGFDGADLLRWSDWLDKLNSQELHSLCVGENDDMEDILIKAPNHQKLDDLLNRIFQIEDN